MALELDEVAITLGRRRLLEIADLTIRPGEVVTLMGPSGSGKSTLLAWMTGLLDPVFEARGRLRADGVDLTAVAPERRRLGLMLQDHLLFPHLSVGGNLAFGLAPGGSRAARRRRIADALAAADLAGYAERDPATLSGGQRARVALLRTLLSEPRALLLDEPFSRLDADLRQRMRLWTFERAREACLPVLLVTHDVADAEAAAGPVITLGDYDG